MPFYAPQVRSGMSARYTYRILPRNWRRCNGGKQPAAISSDRPAMHSSSGRSKQPTPLRDRRSVRSPTLVPRHVVQTVRCVPPPSRRAMCRRDAVSSDGRRIVPGRCGCRRPWDRGCAKRAPLQRLAFPRRPIAHDGVRSQRFSVLVGGHARPHSAVRRPAKGRHTCVEPSSGMPMKPRRRRLPLPSTQSFADMWRRRAGP